MPFRKRKSFVITAVNEGFWEVLAIVSKGSSDSCLWNFKWGDSMLVRWGGGGASTETGVRNRGLLFPGGTEGKAGAPVTRPPFSLGPEHWPVRLAP